MRFVGTVNGFARKLYDCFGIFVKGFSGVYVAVPIVAPIALCGFYSYNDMGFVEVFTRYMRSIFRNKALVFKSGGYREMREEIRVREEAEKRAAIWKAKEERKQRRKERIKEKVNEMIRKWKRKNKDKERGRKR